MLAQAFNYRMFVTPLPIWEYWLWLLFPLLLGIAIVWKAMKAPDVKAFPKQTGRLFAQFVIGFAIAAAIVYAVVELA